MMTREEEKLLKGLKEENKKLEEENLRLKKLLYHQKDKDDGVEKPEERSDFFSRILPYALKNVEHALVITDENGLVTYVNNSFEKMTGFSYQDTKGKNPRDFIKSGLNPADLYENLWKTIKKGQQWSGVIINKKKDRSLYHEEIAITPFQDPKTEKKYFVALKTDITSKVLLHQQLTLSEKRFRDLVYHADGIGVQGYKKDGTVFFWNKASELLYGYNEEEALGKNLLDLIIPQEMKAHVKKRLDNLKSDQSGFPFSEELFLRDKFGKPVHVFTNHSLLINQEKEPEFFCIDIDLSGQDNAESVVKQESKKSEWIAKQGFDLLKCTDTDQCLDIMTQTLYAAMPDTILAVTRFLPDGKSVKLFDVKGLEGSLLNRVAKLLDIDIKSKTFNRIPDRYFEPMKLKKINMGFGWVLKDAGFATGVINKILKIIRVHDNYSINISAKERYLGNVTILTRSPDHVPDSHFVESVVHQTALAMLQIESHQQLQKSEFRFRKILDIVPQFISHVNKELIYDFANKTYETKFEIKPEEMIGKPLKEVIGEKAFQKAYRHIKAVLNGEQVKYLEKLHYKNGQELYIEGTLIPDDFDGEVNGYYGVLNDVTEYIKSRENLKKSEEQYKLIFNSSPLGIFHLDGKGKFVKVNRSFEAITGMKNKDVIGKSIFALGYEEINKHAREVLKGGDAAFDLKYETPVANKSIPVRVLFSPVLSQQKVEGMIGIIEDRSTFVEKAELEKKVAVAEESAKFKQNFLANMSHEIRTPLTGVLGMIDIMENTGRNENYREYISILKQSGDNLREIINQVLDFSKIEAGKTVLHKNTFAFMRLMQKAQHLFDNICKKPIALVISVDPGIPDAIVADEYRITQIINNYLSNAVKFTDEGSITLKAELIKTWQCEDDDQLKIKVSVSDTGRGIEPENQEALFQPFYQIDKYDIRPFEGTGLGLSICKEIACLHGGETGVESEKGKGSTFWFTFIAEPDIHQEAKQYGLFKDNGNNYDQKKIPLDGSFGKKLNILFAEDKKVNQKVVRIMLESLGHHVYVAEDGEETLRVFQKDKFDLILMDIQMPVMDGITATQMLKKKFAKVPPIVGLSANAFEGDREKYMRLGMDEYLTKPVKKEDFLNLIKKIKL